MMLGRKRGGREGYHFLFLPLKDARRGGKRRLSFDNGKNLGLISGFFGLLCR